MMKTKTRLTKTLEQLFPRTMHRYWWRARQTGKTYGINLALLVLNDEMKRIHKNLDTPLLRVEAKQQAKYLQTLIRRVKNLTDVE